MVGNPLKKASIFLVLFALLGFSAGLPVLADDDVLKGGVEETGVAPVKSGPVNLMPMPVPVLDGNTKSDQLKGTAEQNDADLKGDQAKLDKRKPMQGNANMDDDNALAGQNPKLDKRKQPLQGSAAIDDSPFAAQDPDLDDQELMVEWDKWRNRLLWAVQSGVQEVLNNPDESMLRWDPNKNTVVMRFPLGTVAWFSCQVTPDRRVVNLKIMHSSGFPNFDKAVMDSVKNLEGTSILRYPKRSRRKIVSQTAGIKTSESSQQQYFHFGDVEKYRTPGQ